ncbi:MAG: hypothetical protein ACRC2A_04820 [Enterobacterales bacterium]
MTTTNRLTYAPTVTFPPALSIIDNSAINIENITTIDILTSTTFNAGTISSYRTTTTEQSFTVTSNGNLTRDVGANENINILQSWSYSMTGQIDFRVLSDGTQTNVCSSSAYPHAIVTPQSLMAKWWDQNQASSQHGMRQRR